MIQLKSNELYLGFRQLVETLTVEELRDVAQSTANAKDPFYDVLLLKPLLPFINGLLEWGFFESCEIIFDQEIGDLLPLYEKEIELAIACATIHLLCSPSRSR